MSTLKYQKKFNHGKVQNFELKKLVGEMQENYTCANCLVWEIMYKYVDLIKVLKLLKYQNYSDYCSFTLIKFKE